MKRMLEIALFLVLASAAAGQTEPLSARSAVSAQSAFVGEPIQLQIQVSGSDSPAPPDLSALTDFTVKSLGGAANSKTSMTIINGQMSKSVWLGYNFSYEIVPKREGTLLIPAITVIAGGQAVTTQPVQIVAQRPAETDQFKLRAVISKQRAYVGEPLVLDWTFYFQAQVAEGSTNLTKPILESPDFFFYDLEPPGGNQGAVLDGKQYQTLGLRKALIPKKAGTFPIPAATLSFRGLAGYRTAQDFFGRPVKQAQYRQFVIPSNDLVLEVLDVPLQGRPANFAGHIGQYQIQASAAPTEANVGDPITLTVAISGPEYLEHVNLPPLSGQPVLARDFRLPNEIAAGEIRGRAKLFTQTIRAAHAQVSQVPPIELPFFDTVTGTYQIAKSAAIPLAIRETKVVTAGDAEGLSPVLGQTSEIQAWTSGIAHNYESPAALIHHGLDAQQLLASPGVIGMIAAPPLGYVVLFLVLLSMRRRNADPHGVKERRALREFHDQLAKATDSDAVLTALREFLGHKLRLPAGALTFKDIDEPLKKKGVSAETISEIGEIFEQCEASRYSGGGSSEDVEQLRGRSATIAADVEKAFGQGGGFTGLRRLTGVFVALLIALPGLPRAELSEPEISSLFQQGNDLFRQANEISARDAAQAEDLYRKAILRFERIVREGGVENGQLFYNIGNAYFRMNDVGRAILNYRRALRLAPNDSNVHQNLSYARQRRTDKVEIQAQRKVMQTVFFWHYDLPLRVRTILFGSAFVTVWLALGAKLFVRRPFLNWITGVSAVIAVLFLGSLVAEAASAGKNSPGVIVSAEVIARKGDSETYEQSFKAPLHAGAEFEVIETRTDWFYVELGDGRECWLPAKAVELVRLSTN